MTPGRLEEPLPVRLLTKLHLFSSAIRFEHTLFALPFAYIAMFLAADGLPTLSQFIWITVAMGGARTVAMTANRLVHAKEDASNPRTAARHLPRGLLGRKEMAAAMLVAFWALWRLRKHVRVAGWLFGAYLLFAGTERFLIEFIRAKDDRFLAGFTVAQVASIIIAAAGVLLMTRWAKRDQLAIPANSFLRVPKGT